MDTTGIVGLGPQREFDDESIVHMLHHQGVIDAPKVGLNFEDPMSPDLVSSISFGYFDEKSVRYGRRGMNWYPNVGTDTWAMAITESPTYDGIEIANDKSKRHAHIDTAGNHLVVPQAEHNRLYLAMRQQDNTITTYEEEQWQGEIMKSDLSCRELAPLLSDLKLPLKRASLILRPPAFLYSFSGEKNCLIAIEAARTSTDYRLGTLMLRHLYLGLDYAHNDIVLGLNPAANDVYFDGKAHDPYNNAPTLITVIVCILVFGGVAGLYWYNKKCSDGSGRAVSVVDVDDTER